MSTTTHSNDLDSSQEAADHSDDCSSAPDDDRLADNAFAEIDMLEQDVKAKQYAFGTNSTSRRRQHPNNHPHHGNDNRATVIDDDVMKKLALRTSAAVLNSIPGAYDSDGQPLPKPSQERLANLARLRHEEKNRQQYLEQNGPIIGPPNEEEPLDDLQFRMNSFIDHTNKEDEAIQQRNKQQKAKRRRRMVVLGVIGLVVIIGGVIGAVIAGGSTEGDSTNSSGPAASDSSEKATRCVEGLGNSAEESEVFQTIWTVITSEYVAMEIPMTTVNSTARRSLCWMVHNDGAFQLQIKKGEEYGLIQRFTLGLIYFHFTMGESGTDGSQTAGTNPLSTSNWLSAIPECEWDFLECSDGDSGHVVTQFKVDRGGLTGRVPSEMAMLTKLIQIDVSRNMLTGQIPEELWTMTQLNSLNLYYTELTGTLSTELSNLSSLRRLSFGQDLLTGTLPDLSALSNLESFIFENNLDIVGSLPDISGWTNLGSLPTYLGTLSKLTAISLSRTRLTGTLASEWGSLSNLETMTLSEGRFSGSIPSEFGNLSSLRRLHLGQSPLLTGGIPSELGRLSNLEILRFVGSDQLTGMIPIEICVPIAFNLVMNYPRWKPSFPVQIVRLKSISDA